ncbi:MAG: hypothetical protein HKN23_07475 [Verrucomicrobiales bacterium]|nr:hypothetical protein [Verrucomicrobiales bacterium]
MNRDADPHKKNEEENESGQPETDPDEEFHTESPAESESSDRASQPEITRRDFIEKPDSDAPDTCETGNNAKNDPSDDPPKDSANTNDFVVGLNQMELVAAGPGHTGWTFLIDGERYDFTEKNGEFLAVMALSGGLNPDTYVGFRDKASIMALLNMASVGAFDSNLRRCRRALDSFQNPALHAGLLPGCRSRGFRLLVRRQGLQDPKGLLNTWKPSRPFPKPKNDGEKA